MDRFAISLCAPSGKPPQTCRRKRATCIQERALNAERQTPHRGAGPLGPKGAINRLFSTNHPVRIGATNPLAVVMA